MKKSCLIHRCLFSWLLIFPGTIFGRTDDTLYLRKEAYENRLSELKMDFGSNKEMPASIELECLTALSFFPELKHRKIIFRFGNPVSTMVSRPCPGSLFSRKSNRVYMIILKNPGLSANGLEWQKLSFNALVGWIAHELGHIVHYSSKTNIGVLLTGIAYAHPGSRKKLERFTDQLVILHGLGTALYEGTAYSIQHPGISDNYRKRLIRYYLSPQEILEWMKNKDISDVHYRKTSIGWKIKPENSGLNN